MLCLTSHEKNSLSQEPAFGGGLGWSGSAGLAGLGCRVPYPTGGNTRDPIDQISMIKVISMVGVCRDRGYGCAKIRVGWVQSFILYGRIITLSYDCWFSLLLVCVLHALYFVCYIRCVLFLCPTGTACKKTNLTVRRQSYGMSYNNVSAFVASENK